MSEASAVLLVGAMLIGCMAACGEPVDLGSPAASSFEVRPSASTTATAIATTTTTSAFVVTPQQFDFVPEIGEIVATVLDRSRRRIGVIIALHDRDRGSCGDLTTRSMQFVLPDWRAGLVVDLGLLERSSPSAGYAQNASTAKTWVLKLGRAAELTADSRIHPAIPWDPTGTLAVLDAPSGANGKVHVQLANVGFRFEKDLPVRLCVPLD